MRGDGLFETGPVEEPASFDERREGEVRVRRPVRNQLQWVTLDLESTLPQDHRARAILEKLDLSSFYRHIKAVAEGPGRPASDPQVLLGLWLLATADGIGSARQLARLCGEHDAYRWLCGGVPVNYHMLSDFRVGHEQELDDLLVQVTASLMRAGAVRLERVSQDGMRVRASAGAGSFRRREPLKKCLKQARAQVERLAREREHPDPWVNQRQRRAQERMVRQREERIAQALEELPQVAAAKERQQGSKGKKEREKMTEPRASTTDPQARVMKMADGGFRPAYNLQLATDNGSGVIVGVKVVNGGDAGEAPPMEEAVTQDNGKRPKEYLIDGGFATKETITTLERRGVTVYAPVRLPKSKPDQERYQPHYGDSAVVVAWRRRMATAEARSIYRERAATAEWSNAQLSQHGITRFNVRGIAKVSCVALLAVLAP